MSIRDRAIDNQLIKPVNGVKGWKQKTKLIDLQKELAKALNIPFADLCCEEGFQSPLGFPVRWYNDELQQLNSDGTWTAIETSSALAIEDGETLNFSGDGSVSDPLTGEVILSEENESSLLLTQTADGVKLSGTKIRDLTDKEYFSVYKMPEGNLTNLYDPMVSALVTPTITLEDRYDQVVVAGSTIDSYIRFTKQISYAKMAFRLKVRVDALGATAPLIGVRGIWPGASFSNFGNRMYHAAVNLATGVVIEESHSPTVGEIYTDNAWSGTAVVGDIIELEYELDYIYGAKLTAYKANNTGGEVSVRRRFRNPTGSVSNGSSFHTHPAIILADGTYTVLDFEILTFDSVKPKILIVGDSMGGGERIFYNQTVMGHLNSKIPNRTASTAASAMLLSGMNATLYQVLQLKPQYALIFHYLDPLFVGKTANPGNAGYAAWDTSFKRYINILKTYGITPIFVHPESWTFLASAADCQFYTDWLNTNYPTEGKIFVPTSQIVYDATTFHYASATNEYIAEQVIAYLKTQNAL
jgi:hypothetical protein